MLIETKLSGKEKRKSFIYFNPYKKEVFLETYNCGWWGDISWEIRDEHDNIILMAPSLEISSRGYNGIINKEKFINGRTYKIILKTQDPDDKLHMKITFSN